MDERTSLDGPGRDYAPGRAIGRASHVTSVRAATTAYGRQPKAERETNHCERPRRVSSDSRTAVSKYGCRANR
ncbi:hypothetical protein ACS0PU_005466 [Formica fusca]